MGGTGGQDGGLARGEAEVDAGTVRTRVLAVLTYLEEFYRRRNPPVRDIADYKEFRLGDTQLPEVPGVRLTPSGASWLTVRLRPHPPAPSLPDELADKVDGAVTAHRPPSLHRDVAALEDAVDDASEELAEHLEQWVDAEWAPWAEAWRAADRGRSLYKRLFDLRTRLDRDRDSYELVWGFGRLRWTTPDRTVIDHPLVTVPVEVAYDRGSATLEVSPAGGPVVEVAFLAEVLLADRHDYLAQADTVADEPPDMWAAEGEQTLAGLLRAVHHDGVFADGRSPATDDPTCSTGWDLYVRRRQADYVGFLRAQRDIYTADATAIPAPMASLVVQEPSRLGDGSWSDADGGPSERLLLPKPANEEQHRILEVAQRGPGVTVQGPPGTGKSYTIANLVSHFVAHGKRVLVTAEKEHALAVVKDMLPESLRPLAVAYLGTDAASRRDLEASIAAIQGAVHNPAVNTDRNGIARLERRLDELAEQHAATLNDLRDRRAAEVDGVPQSLAAKGHATPSALADWVQAHGDRLDHIPDDVALDTAPPISPSEFGELRRLAGVVEPPDLDAALRRLPPVADLPAAGELAAQDGELARLRDQLADAPVDDWSTVDSTDLAQLKGIADEVESAEASFRKQAGTWLEAARAEMADATLAASWHDVIAHLRNERDKAVVFRNYTAAVEVVLPTDETLTPALFGALDTARERFAGGRGVGRFAPREVRQALAGFRVDGREPATVEDVDVCRAAAELRVLRRRIVNRWTSHVSRLNAPPVPLDEAEVMVGFVVDQLDEAISWDGAVWVPLCRRLSALGVAVPAAPTEASFEDLRRACELLVLRWTERALLAERGRLAAALNDASGPDRSPLWKVLADALATRSWESWDRARAEAGRLATVAPEAGRLRALHDHLASVAPGWAARLTADRGRSAIGPEAFEDAWSWRQADTWIRHHLAQPSTNELQQRLDDIARQRVKLNDELVTTLAWRALADNFTDRHNSALQRFVTVSKRRGKGTGKYTARYDAQIRTALADAMDAVPIWVMPISRVMASFRPSAEPPFDVLIVDEASQVSLTSVPVLGLARKAIVVGDDQQTSPENVGLDLAPVHEMLAHTLSDVPHHQEVFDPSSSLYDMARTKFANIVTLREHFRSLPEIIEFSNRLCYGGNIEALRDRKPSPGWQPLGVVTVRNGYRRANDDVNEPEARAIVDLIAELVAEDRYAGMTFGVISLLGKKQAPHIQSMLLERLGPAEVDKRRIHCGEPANFQGDERDVMVLSLVAAPDEHGNRPRLGAMTKDTDKRRVNVAASRARNQMWVVHSLPADDFSSGDFRAQLIRHCSEPMSVAETFDRLSDGCDSDFERRVLQRILARGYRRVRVQHVVGRYRIDIVVEGSSANVAVECDGDAWHGPERWDADRSRQAVLERSGWTFARITGSAFYRDPDGALEPLWALLDELGVPTGEWTDSDTNFQVRREVTAPTTPMPVLDVDPVDDNDPPAAEGAAEPAPSRQKPDTAPSPSAASDRGGRSTRPTEPPPLGGRVVASSVATQRASSRLARRPVPDPPPEDGALRPYRQWWLRRAIPNAATASRDQLIDVLGEAVTAEGPILAQRAYALYHLRSGGHRVGRQLQETFIAATDAAIRVGRLSVVHEHTVDPAQRTLHLPGTPPIVLRERGPRELYEIPRSEVAALADALGLRDEPTETAMRKLLATYNLGRLTERAAAFLDECLTYRSASVAAAEPETA